MIYHMALIADEAHSLASQHSNRIARLQEQGDKVFEQTVILSNKISYFNLKLRRLLEKVEQATDLVTYIMMQLSKELEMEENFLAFLTQAYRIGRVINPAKPFPRDVIINFANAHLKKRVFDLAREKGSIMHNKDLIHVYLDIAPEALAK